MSASKIPMRYALLVAALMQAMPACAAKADKDADAGGCEDCPDSSGRSGWVEAGIGAQSDDASHFGRYSGLHDSGAVVNLNGAVTYRGKLDGAFLNGEFVDLGLDSRRVSVEGGRQGKYEVGFEYDQIPDYRKRLTSATLQTERDRAGIKFSAVPGRNWEIRGHYRHETKEGTRDVGAGFGYDSPKILAVPVDYRTDDFGVAVGYQGERLQARLAYDGSVFDNGHDAITWANPGVGPASGRIAESPDNQFHQLSAQLGYQLSERTRLGAKFARGRMTQDQSFLPFSTTSATPTGNLNGEVDTTLAKLEVNARPMPRLRLDASYTYSDRDNGTPVNSYAYLLTDYAVSPGTRMNRPYSFTQNLWRLKAGYQFGNGADLSAGFDNDRMTRTYQQAEETEDRTLWARLKLQPLESLDATLKLSHADRDASTYNPTAYGSPETPFMKAFEMADRARDKAGFDLGWAARDNVNVGLSLDYYKDAYKNMVLGLTEASGFSATPSLNYAFSDKLSASLYYTHEKLKSEQAGREWIGITPDWVEADSNQTDTVGLSLEWKAIARKLDVGANLTYSEFTGRMRYPGYTGLPDVHSTLTALGLHGIYALKENLALRLDYRYEKYEETDWANAVPSTVQTLGAAPANQETHLIFVSVRYTFK